MANLLILQKVIILFLINLFIIYDTSADCECYNTILDNPSPGYIFTGPFAETRLALIDNSGVLIYRDSSDFFSEGPTLNYTKQPSGMITYFHGTSKKFYAIDDNYLKIDSFQCINGYETDMHELLVFPEGNYFLLGRDIRKVDMSKIVSGGNPQADVIGYVIQEFDKKKELVFEWNSFDHFNITDATSDVDLTNNTINYVHSNSIDIDTDGNILLSSRYLDEITKINRTTGEVIWRMGGKECKNNEFTFINDSADSFFGFTHQHAAERLPNGNIILFDNGNLRQPEYSRVVEYSVDEINKTATKIWEYIHKPNIYASSQGFVQFLRNGNYFISWGGISNPESPVFTEVRPDGSVAFEMKCNQSGFYRAYKHIYKMSAVTKPISTPGVYDFNESGNETGIKFYISSISGEGTATVEKHEYKPHNIEFYNSPQKFVYPYRWIINHSGNMNMSGTMLFDLNKIKGITEPNIIKVYRRGIEGKGDFYELPTSYNSGANELQATFIGFGEFLLSNDSTVNIEDSPSAAQSITINSNPVSNGTVEFEIHLTEQSNITMRIFNQMGAEVLNPQTILLNRGKNSYPFDCRGLSSGIYFYRITGGKINEIGKFIILK